MEKIQITPSVSFQGHQRNYCTSEEETLALILSFQHFEVYLSSTVTPVLVFTDHNPLVRVQCMKDHNQKLHWSLFLQEFQLDIHYVKGKNNAVADVLSKAL